jgi:AcrR family transcriptional regulator
MEEYTKRQEEIIDKATHIIDKKGIQGLTIKNLSREISVTEGAIYRHFKNKREILDSILEQFKKNQRNFQENTLQSNDSVYDIISAFFLHFRKVFEKNPAIVSVIFAEEIFQNDSELTRKVNEIIQNNEAFMFKVIKKGKEMGELRKDLDEQMMVNSIFGPFRLMVKKWKMQGFKGNLKESVNQLLEYLKATIFVIGNSPLAFSS